LYSVSSCPPCKKARRGGKKREHKQKGKTKKKEHFVKKKCKKSNNKKTLSGKGLSMRPKSMARPTKRALRQKKMQKQATKKTIIGERVVDEA
jgi:hypothetical protein